MESIKRLIERANKIIPFGLNFSGFRMLLLKLSAIISGMHEREREKPARSSLLGPAAHTSLE